MDRRQRHWSRAFSRVAQQAHELEREVKGLRDRESRLQEDVRALERQAAVRAPSREQEGDARGRQGFGPVIHVYLVNGQDFYGVVNTMDGESFSITLSNSAGRILVIPKRNILYYRMKY